MSEIAEKHPKVFISYSWDDKENSKWVRELAMRLRSDSVDVILDQWDVQPGDQLTHFMERSVRESDFVLVVCTPCYKERSDSRMGGVGYEENIITGEVLTGINEKKFIPILKRGEWDKAAPSWLKGKYYVDLRGTRAELMMDVLLKQSETNGGKIPEPGSEGWNKSKEIAKQVLKEFSHEE